MMLAGDEFGRTQGGNNNAYCQDNEISWLDWKLEEKGKSLTRFVQKLTELRRKYPILRRNRFLNGEYVEELGLKDVTWIHSDGSELQGETWAGLQTFGMLLDGRAQTSGIRQYGQEATLLILINAYHEDIAFTLPAAPGGDQSDRSARYRRPGRRVASVLSRRPALPVDESFAVRFGARRRASAEPD